MKIYITIVDTHGNMCLNRGVKGKNHTKEIVPLKDEFLFSVIYFINMNVKNDLKFRPVILIYHHFFFCE